MTPLWKGLAIAGAIGVAVLICTLIDRKDPPNPPAEQLETTRKAYEADTLRLLRLLAQEKAANVIAEDSIQVEIARRKRSERRAALAEQAIDSARASVVAADAGTDSAAMIRSRDNLIVQQDAELAATKKDLSESRAAFDRLTVDFRRAVRRADSAEAGWTRTRIRLSTSDSALAIERSRTGCEIDLIVKTVKCPSRGVMLATGLVLGAAGGILAEKQFQKIQERQ